MTWEHLIWGEGEPPAGDPEPGPEQHGPTLEYEKVDAALEHERDGVLVRLTVSGLERGLLVWDDLELDARHVLAALLVRQLDQAVRRLALPANVIPPTARTTDELVAWLDDPTVRVHFLDTIERFRNGDTYELTYADRIVALETEHEHEHEPPP